MSENIVLVKNAFDETPVTSPVLSTVGLERPDLVEIGTLFDTIPIPDSLVHIANTNELNMTWKELQTILNSLIAEQCKLAEENVKDETTKTMVESLTAKITYSINEHSNCPFTIQRLCELLIEPKKYYKMFVKYLRAIVKVLSVTSYWEDYANTEDKKTEDENMQVEKTDENKQVEKTDENLQVEKADEKTEDESMEEERVEEKAEEEKTDEKMEEEKIGEEKIGEEKIGEEKIDKEEIEENKIEEKSSLPVDNDLDKPTESAKMDLD